MYYELKLSQQHIQVINDALMQMPYYLAAPVVASINEQISALNAAKEKRSEKSTQMPAS